MMEFIVGLVVGVFIGISTICLMIINRGDEDGE